MTVTAYFLQNKTLYHERLDGGSMFICNIEGFPTPTVKWYLNKTKEITASSSVQIKTRKRKKNNKLVSYLTLVEEYTTSKDAGSYWCEASNTAGSDRDLMGWLIDKSSM